jgi:aminopeptidase YwaD
MLTKWRQKVEQELSGRQAYRYAERIAQYHRIQASTGYRQAAENVIALLKCDGVEAELISYPAINGDRFLGHRTFQEWHCQSAELWLTGDDSKRLARYQEQEISLVQRSISTPPEGIHAELIVIENAEDPDSYKGLSLEGKMALVRGNQLAIYDLAVEQHGAAGLVFDNLNEYAPIRTRLDMPDAIQYTSFWWFGEEKKAFGFAVSPRVGEELRTRCKSGTVQLKATVDATLYDGNYENIEFFIPGKKKEEILILSHLCHPYPGGQDNASGPGTLMEVMRTLQQLIQKGELPQPELGIRFLMMPEMTGTYAYFAQHPERQPLTVAALNLDMVGADQNKGGGPLCVEQPPMATPTFVDRFAYSILESLSQDTTNLTGTTAFSSIYYLSTRFSGGSDHYVVSDPTIGIPCPMIIQWPDKHYHTTADSPYNLDEKMMHRVGVLTSLYAYGLANGSEAEWLNFLGQDVGRRYESLRQTVEWTLTQEDSSVGIDDSSVGLKEGLDFNLKYEEGALEQFRRYAELRQFSVLKQKVDWAIQQTKKQVESILEWSEGRADTAVRRTESSLQNTHSDVTETLDSEWKGKIFTRVYSGPIHLMGELERLTSAERINWYQFVKACNVSSGYDVFVQYWMDGERNLEEVLKLVRLETGQFHPKFVVGYIRLCERLGLLQQK